MGYRYLPDSAPEEIREPARSRRLRLPTMGLRVSERRLLLAFVDFLLLIAALAIALTLRTDLLPELRLLFVSWKWVATLAVVWFAFAALFDVYDLARAASTTYSVRSAGMAAAISSFVYLLIPWFTPSLVNRSQGFIFVVLSVLSIIVWRAAYAQLFTQPTFERRALILGTTEAGRALAKALRSPFVQEDANPFRGTGQVLLGFISGSGEQVEGTVAGLPVLGDANSLVRLTRQMGVDEVILALPPEGEMPSVLYEAILDCRELGIQMTQMSKVYERLTGRVAIEYAGGDVSMVAGVEDSPFLRFYTMVKRVMDLFGAALGSLAMLLFMLPLAIINRFTSPGPLFYRQQRIGMGGKPFQIIKFRSMVPDAEKMNGAVWAEEDDPRVTFAGKWLRKLHLDEVPQVINVLKGEMSLVGPRPERPDFAGLLAQEVPFYRARNCMRPGISGWAQIHQDYGSSVDDARIKLEYDLYYVKKASLWLDLVIMLRTVTKVIGLQGR